MEITALQAQCTQVRRDIIRMLAGAGSGHPGGSLSAVEILVTLYGHTMHVDPAQPKMADRDRFVLSKGHAAPALYAVLANNGFFSKDEYAHLRQLGAMLQGHPDMKKCPGIDISTGSLGQGLACGVGMALAAKMDGKRYRVFAALGDGECDEGEIWEACHTANKYQLDNLVVFVDYNNLQLDGTCDEIMPLGDLAAKFRTFGFDVYEIDGNDMEQMVAAMDLALAVKNGKPKCILGHTVKGKGISYMENQCGWHGTAPNEQEYKQAMEELDRQYAAC